MAEALSLPPAGSLTPLTFHSIIPDRLGRLACLDVRLDLLETPVPLRLVRQDRLHGVGRVFQAEIGMTAALKTIVSRAFQGYARPLEPGTARLFL